MCRAERRNTKRLPSRQRLLVLGNRQRRAERRRAFQRKCPPLSRHTCGAAGSVQAVAFEPHSVGSAPRMGTRSLGQPKKSGKGHTARTRRHAQPRAATRRILLRIDMGAGGAAMVAGGAARRPSQRLGRACRAAPAQRDRERHTSPAHTNPTQWWRFTRTTRKFPLRSSCLCRYGRADRLSLRCNRQTESTVPSGATVRVRYS